MGSGDASVGFSESSSHRRNCCSSFDHRTNYRIHSLIRKVSTYTVRDNQYDSTVMNCTGSPGAPDIALVNNDNVSYPSSNVRVSTEPSSILQSPPHRVFASRACRCVIGEAGRKFWMTYRNEYEWPSISCRPKVLVV